MKTENRKFILQVSCPDQSGLIATITQGMAQNGANILDLTQHTAEDINVFFLRALMECPSESELRIREYFSSHEKSKSLDWQIYDANHRTRLALFGSKTDHCLYELFLNHRDGELPCEFSCLISNHTVLEPLSRQFNLPFFLVPSDISKDEQDRKFQEILSASQTEGIVLARYMQILSPEFSDLWKNRIINIHHGFLPAFKGAKPYHQAWTKGVKLIGATAHFVTADLDQGPIIWQSVQQVSDTGSIERFIQIGKDVEKRTLSYALKLWLEHRVFIHEGRTFVL